MADTEKPTSPVKATDTDAPPESPTTARPLDFDDDNQETSVITPTRMTDVDPSPQPPPKDETSPKKPLSQREQNESTLREAFPSIDAAVVKAVLAASGGQVEPAFNALLGMSDPDATKEAEAPAKPPRPAAKPTSTTMSQLEADELYARQLAEHYSGAGRQSSQNPPRTSSRYNEHLQGSRQGKPGASPNPDEVPWRSFIDDDLPEIRDNIRKGFLETQSTVNKWIGNLKKRIDGEDDPNDFNSQPAKPAQGYDRFDHNPNNPQAYGRRSGEFARRSADMSRYDADPEVIGDDFSKLELRDSEGGSGPRKPPRPLANPDLFKTSTARRASPGGRKVSFQDGPPEEIQDMYEASPALAAAAPPARTTSTGKSSKWQPLSAVEPSPVGENDPFSLGDSDDEKDAKPIELKDDDDDTHDRLQKATAEAMNDDIGGDGTKVESKK